eukprot:g3007.t1
MDEKIVRVKLNAARKRCNWYANVPATLKNLNTVLRKLDHEIEKADKQGAGEGEDDHLVRRLMALDDVIFIQKKKAIERMRDDLQAWVNRGEELYNHAQAAFRSLEKGTDASSDVQDALSFFDGLFGNGEFQSAVEALLGRGGGEGEGKGEGGSAGASTSAGAGAGAGAG